MYECDDWKDVEEMVLDHDSAILEALKKTEKGLFDQPEGRDEDLEALYDN